MQQIIRSDESLVEENDQEMGRSIGLDKAKLLKYFLKVIGLFEQTSCHLAVLKVAETAVMCFNEHDPCSVSHKCFHIIYNINFSLFPQAVLWSILFKYHLRLGYYQDAYMDLMSNPDVTRSHFILVCV